MTDLQPNHITSCNMKELPQTAILTRMYIGIKGLAYQHVSEELQRGNNFTLHSDGTCKFGKHYYGFQVALGLVKILSGSATKY